MGRRAISRLSNCGGSKFGKEEVSQLSTLAKTGSKEIGLRSELILRALFVFGTVSISADFHTAELGSDFP